MNRRQFFSRSTAGLALAAFPHVAKSSPALLAAPGQLPASIIHLVADGMSSGTFACADYLSHHLRHRGLTWTRLLARPGVHSCSMNMRSLDSPVTDSAAASSSWGSGSRVPNGALNRLPSGKDLVPLFSLFRQQGWKRGLVTTTEITHATPAGFVARTDNRDNAQEIAAQYLQAEIDLLLGGGAQHFHPAHRTDQRDLSAEFADRGYQLLQSLPDLTAAPLQRRWLGTFADSHLPFTIDWDHDPRLRSRVPHLATMVDRALQWMGRHPHFLLQIEGGRVDHAAHNCDAPSALRDLLAFDEALDLVLQFQSNRPDTLIVITTDHGNGNLGLNGSGENYRDSSAAFQALADSRASFPEILRQLGAPATHSAAAPPEIRALRQVIEHSTGYPVPEAKAALFQRFLSAETASLYDAMNSPTAQLGQLLANHHGIGWTSGAHTADFVPLTAIGPGSERFSGFLQNTDLFRRYTAFAGIDHQNPQDPPVARRKLAAAENTRAYARASA